MADNFKNTVGGGASFAAGDVSEWEKITSLKNRKVDINISASAPNTPDAVVIEVWTRSKVKSGTSEPLNKHTHSATAEELSKNTVWLDIGEIGADEVMIKVPTITGGDGVINNVVLRSAT